MTDKRPHITVCDRCLRVTCWTGYDLCDDAVGAGTVDLPTATVESLRREHPSYWDGRSFVKDEAIRRSEGT